MRTITIRRALALIAAAATSCGGEPADPIGVTALVDSAGIEISNTDLSDPTALATCRVADAPDLQVGANDDAGVQLFRVEGALRLPDGRLLVLNRGYKEILAFGLDGSLSGKVGTEGDGPGEFRDPIELHLLRADSVAVWDWGQSRVTVLTPALGYARSFLPQPAMPNPTGHFGVIAGGSSVLASFHALQIPGGTSFAPQSIVLLRYSADGVFQDSVAVLPYGTAGIIDAESRMLGSPLFDARSSFATDGHRTYISTGTSAEIRVLDEQLRDIRHIRWLTPDRTVTDADAEAFRAQRLEGVSEGHLPLMRRRYEAVPVAEQFPAVADLRIDEQGGLWIQRFQRPQSEDQTWWSYDSRGMFRCLLSLPRNLEVAQFGGGVMTAVSTDEFGRESVVVFSVSGPEQ